MKKSGHLLAIAFVLVVAANQPGIFNGPAKWAGPGWYAIMGTPVGSARPVGGPYGSSATCRAQWFAASINCAYFDSQTKWTSQGLPL
jgi:hypothetical protein